MIQTSHKIDGKFDKKEDEYGHLHLTVDGVIEMLKILSKQGYGSRIFKVTYDSNFACTSIHGYFGIDDTTLFLEGD